MVQTPYGFLVFDDTIVDKNFSHKIELVRRQYSGNAHGVIKGCLLYTSDAADERSSVDLGGRRIIKKKKNTDTWRDRISQQYLR